MLSAVVDNFNVYSNCIVVLIYKQLDFPV